MLPHYDLRNRIQEARLHRGLSLAQLSARTGVSEDTLDYVERRLAELNYGVSIRDVIALFRELELDPPLLFRPTAKVTGSFGFDDLSATMRTFLAETAVSVPEFEDRVGWSVNEALNDPAVFLQFNLDGIRAVADAVGANWVDVLSTEIDRSG